MNLKRPTAFVSHFRDGPRANTLSVSAPAIYEDLQRKSGRAGRRRDHSA